VDADGRPDGYALYPYGDTQPTSWEGPKLFARALPDGPAMNDPLRKLAQSDGRYSPEALRFLLESLDHAVRLAGKENAEGTARHVTGQELLAGVPLFGDHEVDLRTPLRAGEPLEAHFRRALAEKPKEHELLQMKIGGLRALSQVGG